MITKRTGRADTGTGMDKLFADSGRFPQMLPDLVYLSLQKHLQNLVTRTTGPLTAHEKGASGRK